MDGMVERIWEELGYQAVAVATGGLAGSIIPYCKNKIICDNELTLKGLNVIYQKNMESGNDVGGSGRDHYHVRLFGKGDMLYLELEIPVKGIHQTFVSRQFFKSNGQ